MKLESNLKELFIKYLNRQASVEEVSQLLDFFQLEEDSDQLKALIHEELDSSDNMNLGLDNELVLERVSVALRERIKSSQRRSIRLYWMRATAAAVLLIAGVWGMYGLFTVPTDESVAMDSGLAIVPGQEKATLVLEDGRVIDLDSSSALEEDGGIVFVDAHGTRTFNTNKLSDQGIDQIRTVNTPRGGQFAVILSDGTKVWLNAESSITFPTKFGEVDRKVDVTGEVYFEVKSEKNRPFFVAARGQEIKVLGTHFNVNAYPERKVVATSLLEGSVQVTAGGRKVKLVPGEVSLWSELDGGLGKDRISNVDDLLAWKDGMFSFQNASITEIMQVLARWYDVDVSFEKGDYSDCVFGGIVPKRESIGQVLKILSASQQLEFKISRKKILVYRFSKNN